MDFTPELASFQGVLISADNVYSFSKLTAKGGNEPKIEYIVEVIRKFFRDQNLIGPNGLLDQAISKVRKFALYLILNSDFLVLEEMVEIEEINSVIWTIPTVPKCLLFELLCNIYMEKFLYEAITHIHPQLAIDLAKAYLDHFKYFDPSDVSCKLKHLTAACYFQICRMNCIQIEKNDLVNKLTSAFTNLQNSLKLYIQPPNTHKLRLLSTDETYKHKGLLFHDFLLCAFNCLEQFMNNLNNQANKSVDIYFLTYDKNSIINEALNLNVCDTKNKDILEYLNKSNEEILDTCKTLVMDVSLDIFCAWSEFEENNKSMQQVIGELSYKLVNKISEIPTFVDHPVVSMMTQISRKPVDIRDLINVTDSNAIIENINKNDEDKDSWLHALLERNNLCQDTNLLNIIESNLNKFDSELCYKLYKIIQIHLRNNAENQENLKLFSIKVFQQCSLPDKYKILDNTFSDNYFTNVNETTEFSSMMTETFNKLVISPETAIDVLKVFLQNPCEVYNKINTLAVESTQQADIMLNVSLLIKSYCNHYYKDEIEPCVVKCTRSMLENALDTEKKHNNAIKFVCSLVHDIIPRNKLLMLIIMPNMHKALINKNISNIHIQIRLLKEAYSVNDMIVYRAPMLAMLAQILDVVRWIINTFTPISPSALEDTLQLQNSIIQTYGDNIPEKEKVWLKNKMINLQPLNMYYYKILWKPPGNNFLEIISGMTINVETNQHDITTLLTQVICSISQQEWCYIWDSLHVLQDTVALKLLHDALSIVTLAEVANRTDTSWMCIHYCYRCFFFITRYKFFKEPLSSRQVSYFANIISATAKLIKEENAEDIGNILLPLLAYLSERKEDNKIDLANYLGEFLQNTPLAFVVKLVFPNANV